MRHWFSISLILLTTGNVLKTSPNKSYIAKLTINPYWNADKTTILMVDSRLKEELAEIEVITIISGVNESRYIISGVKTRTLVRISWMGITREIMPYTVYTLKRSWSAVSSFVIWRCTFSTNSWRFALTRKVTKVTTIIALQLFVRQYVKMHNTRHQFDG